MLGALPPSVVASVPLAAAPVFVTVKMFSGDSPGMGTVPKSKLVGDIESAADGVVGGAAGGAAGAGFGFFLHFFFLCPPDFFLHLLDEAVGPFPGAAAGRATKPAASDAVIASDAMARHRGNLLASKDDTVGS